MRVVLYSRVSTEEQALSRLGLEAQAATLERAAEYKEWDVVARVVDEGYSAKSLERPGIRRVLEMIARCEADALAVSKLDRLTRSQRDLQDLIDWCEDGDVGLITLDFDTDMTTAMGRLMLGFAAAIAQLERDQISERTTAALAELRRRGEPVGRPSVADRPEVAEAIRQMRQAGYSMQKIADKLTADGVPTARGAKVWHVSAVQASLGYKRKRSRGKRAELPDLAFRRAELRRRGRAAR